MTIWRVLVQILLSVREREIPGSQVQDGACGVG
jgi:hypothetical protein